MTVEKAAGTGPAVYERDARWYWLDESQHEHGPCSSEKSARRRLKMYCAVEFGGVANIVPDAEWTVRRVEESEAAVHPCTDAAPWDCECSGACSCHWLKIFNREELEATR